MNTVSICLYITRIDTGINSSDHLQIHSNYFRHGNIARLQRLLDSLYQQNKPDRKFIILLREDHFLLWKILRNQFFVPLLILTSLSYLGVIRTYLCTISILRYAQHVMIADFTTFLWKRISLSNIYETFLVWFLISQINLHEYSIYLFVYNKDWHWY